jgi:hypothetical protein
VSQSGKDPGFKVFALSAEEVGKEVVFDPQPESFDGIEVGAVGSDSSQNIQILY